MKAQRSTEKTFNILIVGMVKRDKKSMDHIATKWGWREDENWPPYE